MIKHLFALSVGVLLAMGANGQNTNSSGQNNGQGIVHWKLDGNTANDNHFIGTVNEKPLVFKSNSLEGIRLLTDGSIRLEQLKQQPNENTLGLPRVMVIQEDGTLGFLSGQELVEKIMIEIPKELQPTCVDGPNSDGSYSAVWQPKVGNPAKITANSICGSVFIGINTQNPTHSLEVVGSSYFTQPMKIRTNLGDDYKPFFITSNIGEDVFRVMGDGKVWATEINVRLKENFPDYVFAEEYKLFSLSQLETYIKENNHLPNMPTAEEVECDGLDLGEMNRLLVEKVEELTLYLIEQNKKIELLQAEINQFKKQ